MTELLCIRQRVLFIYIYLLQKYMVKKKTIAQYAKELGFDDIYSRMNKLKIQRDTIQKDISGLALKRNALDDQITKLSNIALAKRRFIVNKK